MSAENQHISFFDKSYSESKANDYILYIELSRTGLKLTVLTTDNNTYIGFEEYRFTDIYNDYSILAPLNKILESNPIFKCNFKSISIAFVNNRSTLVPNSVYKADKLASFHQFNFSKQEEDVFFSDQLINLSAYNIYSIPDFIINAFKNLKNVKFTHFSSALIEAALIGTKSDKALSQVYLHVLPDSFQIMVIKNQKLELYNSFIYQSSEDFIYYLLFVLDQFNINNEEANITLTGDVEKNSVIYSMLHKYIQTITFGKRTKQLNFSYVFEETPEHFHHALFNQYLCE